MPTDNFRFSCQQRSNFTERATGPTNLGGHVATILFVHRHGPGQFLHLAGHLVRQGHDVVMLCETSDQAVIGVKVIQHRPVGPDRGGKSAVDYQTRVGTSAAEAMDEWRQRGGAPDIIVGHSGWGSLLFAKDVFPGTPLLAYCEHYYRHKGADVGFDPSETIGIDDIARLKARNFAQVTTLLSADAGLSPTRWQQSGYPEALARRIGVIHEGINTQFCRPDANAQFVLPDGRTLRAGDPVVTYAARNLEPYRGFPQFMRAAAELTRINPAAVIVVAGADGTSYGAGPRSGGSWREAMLRETGIDPARIHFVGTLPHEALIRLFQVSAAHVYLSYPFVLSWSMLEAMSAGVLLIGSDTPPVAEFVRHERNGILVPFFDTTALTDTLAEALAGRKGALEMRQAARQTIIDQVAMSRSLARQTALIERMIGTQPIWTGGGLVSAGSYGG